MAGTSFQNGLKVGAGAGILTLGTLIGIFVGNVAFRGDIQIQNSGKVDFRGSDVNIALSGSSLLRVREVSCTGTGGNAAYDTCRMTNPLSSTGVVHRIQLEFGNAPANVNVDCAFNFAAKTTTGTTTTAIKNLDNVASGTGKVAIFATGSLLWNGDAGLKCGTLTNPTSGFTAKLRVWYSDLYGE